MGSSWLPRQMKKRKRKMRIVDPECQTPDSTFGTPRSQPPRRARIKKDTITQEKKRVRQEAMGGIGPWAAEHCPIASSIERQ